MNEEELRQGVAELEAYQAQLDSLKKQDEILRINIEEFMRARDTLDGIKGNKKGDEILVPIGANFFVKARIEDPGNVISNLGATVAAGETTEKAVERLDKHVKELNDAGQKLAQNVAELESKAAMLTQELQKEYAKLQAEE